MKKTKLTEKPSSILDIAEENISPEIQRIYRGNLSIKYRTCKGSKIFYSV